MHLFERLERSRNDGAILFCGAGFSAECLNFAFDETLGVSGSLVATLNEGLKPTTYTKLTSAAKAYEQAHFTSGLRNLLRKRFHVSAITDDMMEILQYPWSRIYTTNFDNAIEHGLTALHKPFNPCNNTTEPPAHADERTEVVYLHGRAQSWESDAEFKRSCVLTTDDYSDPLAKIGPWASQLQKDYGSSSLFVFVGFSASDFHLNRIFFNASASRDKVFFVNRASAHPSPDMLVDQEPFGTSLQIGTDGLATRVHDALQSSPQRIPHHPSFLRYSRCVSAAEVPSTQAITDLLLFGAVDPAQVARDLEVPDRSDYHLRRKKALDAFNAIAAGNKLVLLTGEICDGKSLIVEDLAFLLSSSRPVFLHRQTYDSFEQEVREIAETAPDAVIIVENCFRLRHNLDHLVNETKRLGPSLLLTARSISAQAEVDEYHRLKDRSDLIHIRLGQLDDAEIHTLIRLADQIASWREFPSTPARRFDFIAQTCKRSLPKFLLELLRSPVARDRYAEEFNRVVSGMSREERMAIVGALCLSHAGSDGTTGFLSDLFSLDIHALLRRLNQPNAGFQLVRTEGQFIRTVPTIGARVILESIVPAMDGRLLVDTILHMVRALANVWRGDQEDYVFKQLMRYSVLQIVLPKSNQAEHDRFFSALSQLDRVRGLVLFWLQWHLCMSDRKDWNKAETYLTQAYTRADEQDKKSRDPNNRYDRFQLDDARSKLLLRRAIDLPWNARMIQDFTEACQITGRLMRRSDVTHHPFRTLRLLVEFHKVHGRNFLGTLASVARARLVEMLSLADTRRGLIVDPLRREGEATENVESLRTYLNSLP